MSAEGLTRRVRPQTSIKQVGNLVNSSIHLADFLICMGDCMDRPRNVGRFHYRVLRLIYEGALLFVTGISCNYTDLQYKGDWRELIIEGPRLSRILKQLLIGPPPRRDLARARSSAGAACIAGRLHRYTANI
jgi:hypothetical protein